METASKRLNEPSNINNYEDNPFERDDDDSTADPRNIALQVQMFVRANLDLPPSKDLSPAFLKTPVFLGHGTADAIVPVKLAEEMARTLGTLGMNVTWKAYQDFGHWYKVPDEIDHIEELSETQVGLKSV